MVNIYTSVDKIYYRIVFVNTFINSLIYQKLVILWFSNMYRKNVYIYVTQSEFKIFLIIPLQTLEHLKLISNSL